MIRRWRPGGRAHVGRRGERLAARWLRRRGYRILHRNLRLGDDEADLIVETRDRNTIVIVEVKTRTSDAIAPELNIGAKKQFRLSRLAARLMRRPEFAGRAVRFDAVAIVMEPGARPIVRHYESAFDGAF